jgi:hypothetical protein
MKKKEYKIFETMHNKQRFYLVFDKKNEVVGKFQNKDMATKWMEQEVEQNKQAQNA